MKTRKKRHSYYLYYLPDEGFEPSPPKRLDLKSSALDHSANRAS